MMRLHGTDHSYEEIRDAVYAVLRSGSIAGAPQYVQLRTSIAEYFYKIEGHEPHPGHGPRLSPHDADLYLEVFWALFREGIITLGSNDSNPNFPFFRVTQYGTNSLNNQDPYFFTDVSDYERQLRAVVPSVHAVTMLYVKEAVQTFRIGCLLASSVMIGVASEHTFNLLLETVEVNAVHGPKFAKVFKEKTILRRLTQFKKALDDHPELLTGEAKEDLDTRFMGVVSLIRTYRNDAGHPTGKILEREQAYVNLQLFIPYAQKLYQLMEVLA
jgi:hypothetical protein